MEYKVGYNLIMLLLISDADLETVKNDGKKREKEKDSYVGGKIVMCEGEGEGVQDRKSC
jgi:hypothetical protein